MDASSSAGVTKGELGLCKFASNASLSADSKFLLHWFGLSAEKNGCVDEKLPVHCHGPTLPRTQPSWMRMHSMCLSLSPSCGSLLTLLVSLVTACSFSLTNDGESMEDKLPCPLPWNPFARNVSQPEGGYN